MASKHRGPSTVVAAHRIVRVMVLPVPIVGSNPTFKIIIGIIVVASNNRLSPSHQAAIRFQVKLPGPQLPQRRGRPPIDERPAAKHLCVQPPHPPQTPVTPQLCGFRLVGCNTVEPSDDDDDDDDDLRTGFRI